MSGLQITVKQLESETFRCAQLVSSYKAAAVERIAANV